MKLSKMATLATLFMLILAVYLPAVDMEVARKIEHIKNYRPVPGDVYTLYIDFGALPTDGSSSKPVEYPMPLQQDYSLEVPMIGTLNVQGLTYTELRKRIIDAIRRVVPVQYVDLTLTSPAIFDVFVYGNIKQPGNNTAASIMTVRDLLGVAGGPTTGASMRNIELRRGEDTIICDIMTYLTYGDESQNPLLLPGDKIYIPTVREAVQLKGAVVKPGLYEIIEGETLEDVITFSGGLLPTALKNSISVLRLDESNRYVFEKTEPDDFANFLLKSGDQIAIRATTDNAMKIGVEGAFYGKPDEGISPVIIPDKPITRVNLPFHEGMSMLEVMELLGGPTPFAIAERSYIRRHSTGERVEIPDLKEIWENRDYSKDIILEAGDLFVVPMKSPYVMVGGNVQDADKFPFASGLTVADYLLAARGFTRDADPEGLYFTNTDGTLTKVSTTTEVTEPGTVIYVADNGWKVASEWIGRIALIVGIFSSVAIVAKFVDDYVVDLGRIIQ